MTLWMMLCLTASATAFGTSMAAAVAAGGGRFSLLVAGIAGAIFAILATAIPDAVGKRVLTTIRSDIGNAGRRRLRILYWGVTLWVPVAGYLAYVMTGSLVDVFAQ